jgi:acetylglutamate kinase
MTRHIGILKAGGDSPGLNAAIRGVGKAAIIDGRIPHSILLEIFTQEGIGTEVTSGVGRP